MEEIGSRQNRNSGRLVGDIGSRQNGNRCSGNPGSRKTGIGGGEIGLGVDEMKMEIVRSRGNWTK